MKQVIFAALVFFSVTSHAQVGIGTVSPNGSAQLDISSADKGILIPRMTAIEVAAIASPATGLLVFQTDDIPGFYFYNGAIWTLLHTGVLPVGNGGTGAATQNFVDLSSDQAIGGVKNFSSDIHADSITASAYAVPAGTSSQFLKADGSVDANTYLTSGTAGTSYLPITGGTLTGALAGTTADYSGNATVGGTLGVTGNLTAAGTSNTLGTITSGIWNAGAVTSSDSITGNTIVKSGGTSSQFLKADGSVDAGNYVTSADVATGYLPITGGALTGGLAGTTADYSGNTTVGGTLGVTGNLTAAGTSNTLGTITSGIWNAGAVTSSDSITGNKIVKSGGTSSQFLKADGSVDAGNYVTSADVATGYLPVTGGVLTGGLAGTTATYSGNTTVGGTLGVTGNLTAAGTSNTLGTVTSGIWNAGAVTSSDSIKANKIVKSGGTSSQFLKADGSVDANTYITSASGFLPLAGGTMSGNINTNTQSLSYNGSTTGMQMLPEGGMTVYGIRNASLSTTRELNLQLDKAGGFVVKGVLGTGTIPASGSGERMMWHAYKGSFRAGGVGVGVDSWDENNNGFYSVAFGFNTKAYGNYTTSIGYANSAMQSYGLAMGYTSISDGTAAIAIGYKCNANADYAVALGQRASANAKSGTMVMSDASNTDSLLASQINQFNARYANGYRLYTNATKTIGVSVAPGGNSWAAISDSTKKENYIKPNYEYFLKELGKLRIGSWNYTAQDKAVRHYGPMAQEIFSAFGKDPIGTIGCDTTLATADMDGVIMIMLQGLEKRSADQLTLNKQLAADMAKLNVENSLLQEKLAKVTDPQKLQQTIQTQTALIEQQSNKITELTSEAMELRKIKLRVESLEKMMNSSAIKL